MEKKISLKSRHLCFPYAQSIGSLCYSNQTLSPYRSFSFEDRVEFGTSAAPQLLASRSISFNDALGLDRVLEPANNPGYHGFLLLVSSLCAGVVQHLIGRPDCGMALSVFFICGVAFEALASLETKPAGRGIASWSALNA